MSSIRRFLLAPSLARLIERERGAHHLIEGFFPDKNARSTYVRSGNGSNLLVLVEHGTRGEEEIAFPLPVMQVLALLEYTAHRIEYRQVTLAAEETSLSVHRLTMPWQIDFILVEFAREEHALAFSPPAWFGPEITDAPEYQHRRIAFNGLSNVPEVEVTDMALNSLLDVLEGQGAAHQAALLVPRPPKLPLSPVDDQAVEAEGTGIEDNDIEDEAIRDIARSLRPKRR